MPESVFNEKPEALRKLLKAWYKALNYLKANPDEAVAIMARYYDLSPEEFKEIALGVEWPLIDESFEFLGKDVKNSQAGKLVGSFSDIFIEAGKTNKAVKAEEVLDSEILSSLR